MCDPKICYFRIVFHRKHLRSIFEPLELIVREFNKVRESLLLSFQRVESFNVCLLFKWREYRDGSSREKSNFSMKFYDKEMKTFEKKLLKNMRRRNERWLIPFSVPILSFFRCYANSNLSTKILSFFHRFRFPQSASVCSQARAIDINLISKLLFKSKQMYFIVRNYWQYVLRDVKKEIWQRDNNERLLS